MAVIVFSHANGFPAGCYRMLFEAWRLAGHEVHAPDKFGHDPKHPVTSNWPHVRDELIGFVERHAGNRPVILVGHSLGGYLSLLLACRRPELTAGVILLDSPIVGGWRAGVLRLGKATGLVERLGPGRISRGRRQFWVTADAALSHFAAKPAFARWVARVLADYIASCTEAAPEGGVQLTFRRDVESHFYNTLPHHFDRVLKRHPPRCQVAFIGGRASTEVQRAGLALTTLLAGERLRWVEGSHLFPMEQPEMAARAVLDALATMQPMEKAA